MKIQILIVAALMFMSLSNIAAQAKTKKAKDFSVACAKALQFGVEKVEALHDAEMKRRVKGNSDSGTESAATENALKNYINCRRARNAAALKTFTAADTIAEVKRQETSAKKLAQMRFDKLIFGISWDEKGADSINYPMTLRAVALVEDYKGALVYSYAQNVEPDADEAEARAGKNEKTIQTLLAKMEDQGFEDSDAAEEYKPSFTKFKTAINQFLRENSNLVSTEKAATTDFVVKLLKLGLSDK